MSRVGRKNFTPEFRLECAQLVVDQKYSIREAAEAMNVSKSSIEQWATRLRNERKGDVSTAATPLTSEQLRIRELEKRVKRLELEKEILKKASALLMTDSIKDSF